MGYFLIAGMASEPMLGSTGPFFVALFGGLSFGCRPEDSIKTQYRELDRERLHP
jgi:hypothetical protein